MKSKLDLIILLDDNNATNYFHEKIIKESKIIKNCMAFQNGPELLNYFESKKCIIPELIYMDINMPEMNAWEFIKEFEKIKSKHLKNIVFILLSTSLSPSDKVLAENISLIKEVQIKPLTVASIHKTVNTYF